MKKGIILFVTVLAITLSACNSKDGTYIVYRVEADHEIFYDEPRTGRDKEAQQQLERYMIGKRFKIEFEDKFALLKSVKKSEDILLTKTDIDYSRIIQIDNDRFKLRLKKSSTGDLLLSVDLDSDRWPELIPVQRGGTVSRGPSSARAVCYLNLE
ncbi:hypothetical protein [Daejeonella sp. JGW-45]|uniref:hypothetical protein n=1 Tax=Daejeonella sp. JGW-45 TaxID=3034148 RepID=UPI0023EB2E48|nr:hypothetical protein [Daejeonella sp. JGW-45]